MLHGQIPENQEFCKFYFFHSYFHVLLLYYDWNIFGLCYTHTQRSVNTLGYNNSPNVTVRRTHCNITHDMTTAV